MSNSKRVRLIHVEIVSPSLVSRRALRERIGILERIVLPLGIEPNRATVD